LKSDDLCLHHILDAIKKIELYVSVGRDRVMSESQWHDATVRRLEIIGEATKQLFSEVKHGPQNCTGHNREREDRMCQ
jgi:uncharacterized protein with HEPN domain